eukprot:8689571-Alexandrium_andersonii.AAC.1
MEHIMSRRGPLVFVGATPRAFLFTQRRNLTGKMKELAQQRRQVGRAATSAERRRLVNPSPQAARPAAPAG